MFLYYLAYTNITWLLHIHTTLHSYPTPGSAGLWPTDTAQECEAKCLNVPGCNGFTWTKNIAENEGNAGICYTKTGNVKISGGYKAWSALLPCP